MHKPCEYIATAEWHRNTGSYQYYITAMQEKAAATNAPIDALFCRGDKWVCVSDLATNHHFREWYESLAFA